MSPVTLGKSIALLFFHYVLLLVIVIVTMATYVSARDSISKTSNPLSGKQIRVLANLLVLENDVKLNNISGIVELSGVTSKIIAYLTNRYNFTYTIVQGVKAMTVQSPSSGGRGLIDYVIAGECELIVGPVILTPFRYALADMTMPWTQTSMFLLIPKPNIHANLTSILKPFQWPVWILLLLSIVTVVAFFYLVNYYSERPLFHYSSRQKALVKQKCDTKVVNDQTLYTIGVLLSQGGPCRSQKLKVRTLAGAWCLAAAVLVNSYSSVLVTYVLAPNSPPLINSVYDIVQSDHIKLVVDKGRGFDVVISTSTEEKGIFKQLRNKLNTYSRSRCSTRAECVELVKSGGEIAYGSAFEYLVTTISEDFKSNGNKCQIQMAKEGFMQSLIGWVLPKRSSYTNIINKGILELQETGLIKQWVGERHVVPPQCRNANIKKGNNQAGRVRRLTLRDLTGAFVVVLVGYGISFIVFVGERIRNLS